VRLLHRARPKLVLNSTKADASGSEVLISIDRLRSRREQDIAGAIRAFALVTDLSRLIAQPPFALRTTKVIKRIVLSGPSPQEQDNSDNQDSRHAKDHDHNGGVHRSSLPCPRRLQATSPILLI
jgi:hypothetical protein